MPKKRPVPDPDDVRNSLKRQRILLHYESMEEELHWTPERYRTLCHALSLTSYELGAFVRARICDVDRWLLARSFPPPVELHLTFIERVALKRPVNKSLFPPL